MVSLLPFAFLVDSLGGSEMVVIFLVVLLLFGGKKLPEFARGLGKSMREFKKAASGVEEEFKRALEEDEQRTLAAAKPVVPVTTPEALLPAASEPDHSIMPPASETPVDTSTLEASPPVAPIVDTPAADLPAPDASLTTPSPTETPDTPPPAPDHPPEKKP